MKKFLLIVLLSLPITAFSGGPIAISGPNGNTPVRYASPTITLNFDIGTLGNRSNAETDALVLQSIDQWNAVSTATINLLQGADLATDIDITNYLNLVPSGEPNDPSIKDGLNPVIYDTDGQIIDALLGVGVGKDIIGFAGSIYFLGSSTFTEGYAVLNGDTNFNLSNNTIITLITHEIGHMIGLDHSQLDINNTESECLNSHTGYPIMYPYICRNTSTLHADDVVAITALYPATNLEATYGQITGFFINSSGNPILGANLWAKNTITGMGYSVVSDYLKQNTGFFSILLPAGNYTLHANAINASFFDLSSVGPYANSATDISFISPLSGIVNFEGNTPGSTKSLPVTTGKATEVNFVNNGSGTFTTDKSIFIAGPPEAGSDNSGTLSPAIFFVMLIVYYFRKTHKNRGAIYDYHSSRSTKCMFNNLTRFRW